MRLRQLRQWNFRKQEIASVLLNVLRGVSPVVGLDYNPTRRQDVVAIVVGKSPSAPREIGEKVRRPPNLDRILLLDECTPCTTREMCIAGQKDVALVRDRLR